MSAAGRGEEERGFAGCQPLQVTMVFFESGLPGILNSSFPCGAPNAAMRRADLRRFASIFLPAKHSGGMGGEEAGNLLQFGFTQAEFRRADDAVELFGCAQPHNGGGYLGPPERPGNGHLAGRAAMACAD